MLTKIEDKEIMTHRQAAEKYRDKYFMMVITDVVDSLDNDLGYVIYTADRQGEFTGVLTEEYDDLIVSFSLGVAAEPEIQLGGVYFG